MSLCLDFQRLSSCFLPSLLWYAINQSGWAAYLPHKVSFHPGTETCNLYSFSLEKWLSSLMNLTSSFALWRSRLHQCQTNKIGITDMQAHFRDCYGTSRSYGNLTCILSSSFSTDMETSTISYQANTQFGSPLSLRAYFCLIQGKSKGLRKLRWWQSAHPHSQWPLSMWFCRL